MNALTKKIEKSLERPTAALRYDLSRWIADEYEGFAILETEDDDFDVVRFAETGGCVLMRTPDAAPMLDASWNRNERDLELKTRIATSEVLWLSHRLRLVAVKVTEYDVRYSIVADSFQVAETFFRAVCMASQDGHGHALVFANGEWKRSRTLLDEIRGASLDDLVLAPRVREQLVADTLGFFAARETYRRYGIPWKRGLILYGDPGNGKTHALKAILNLVDRPCLVVRSLKVYRQTEEYAMEQVFARARSAAPCVLIFEDVDTLVSSALRSPFLNELDGFRSNDGILTLATANDLERLDPALIERPSRFDRKIWFEPPDDARRLEYLRRWATKWEPEMRPTETEIAEIATLTQGYSFAYMKELCTSATMAWIATARAGTMGDVLRQVEAGLRREMSSKPPTPDEDED